VKEEDFMELVKNTRLSRTSRDAARLVLVEGLSQTEAATSCNLSKQRINAIVGTVRRAERQALGVAGSNALVAAIEASYAFAVKAARDELGDQVRIETPAETTRTVGPVIARTDFHLVQLLGRDSVVIHELAKLDQVPAIGKSAKIQYEGGRGVVIDREQQRVGPSR
jgi:predicted DNA-binding protein (UPF0251 family)